MKSEQVGYSPDKKPIRCPWITKLWHKGIGPWQLRMSIYVCPFNQINKCSETFDLPQTMWLISTGAVGRTEILKLLKCVRHLSEWLPYSMLYSIRRCAVSCRGPWLISRSSARLPQSAPSWHAHVASLSRQMSPCCWKVSHQVPM